MFLSKSGQDKLRTCVHDAVKIINFTNCGTWFIVTIHSRTHIFSLSSTWSNSKKLSLHTLNNNLYVRFLTATMWSVFHFVFYVLCLMVWNLIIVFKSNLQWSCLPACSFSTRPQLLEVKKPSMEKLKFKLDGVFGMFLFFRIMKKMQLFVCLFFDFII